MLAQFFRYDNTSLIFFLNFHEKSRIMIFFFFLLNFHDKLQIEPKWKREKKKKEKKKIKIIIKLNI